MQRKMLKAKIHRATITDACVDYEGSVTVDAELLHAADILPNEAVAVWDVDNAARFETYAIAGDAGTGVICVNGAAAHLVEPGHRVIIAAFAWMDDAEARDWEPTVVFVDEANRISESRAEKLP